MIVYKQWYKYGEPNYHVRHWYDGWYLFGVLPLYRRKVTRSAHEESPFQLFF